ncbi:MAG: HutD family protein, partial [Ottowia sp.]|nr:HutD family protein [Ottowia sp.]
MSGLQPFALADLPAEPWKNGGGRTRTVATWPAGAGLSDFDARVSVATIAASGPFSRFPGIDRQIVLLSGGGV